MLLIYITACYLELSPLWHGHKAGAMSFEAQNQTAFVNTIASLKACIVLISGTDAITFEFKGILLTFTYIEAFQAVCAVKQKVYS